MARRIVILGGGTGGTLCANRLRRLYGDDEVEIVVVDQDDEHVYQPGLLFVPFGLAQPDDIVRPRRRQLHAASSSARRAIDRVDVDGDRSTSTTAAVLDYDVLVVATGAVLAPEETEGLTGPGWMEKVFTFYDLDGAHGAARRARGASTGAASSSTSSTCRSSARSRRSSSASSPTGTSSERGIRDRVELTYVTPLDGAFTKPVAVEQLGGLLEEKGVELVTEFNTGEVDGDGRAARLLRRPRGRLRPGRGDPAARRRRATSAGPPGLGDELGFVAADQHTLQSKRRRTSSPSATPPAFPTSKAGSVTHFEGEVLVENIRRFLGRRAAGRELRRARQLLHRDRLRQGPADRLQLRHRAAARATSRVGRACRCSRSRGSTTSAS